MTLLEIIVEVVATAVGIFLTAVLTWLLGLMFFTVFLSVG